MPDTLSPTTPDELSDAIASAASEGTKLSIRGGGSKDAIGRPVSAVRTLDMSHFSGVIDYDPPELILTVGPGTPLSEINALVAGEKQMLAFDPYDHGPMLGKEAGAATIGGIVSAGVSGPRRLSAGAARDHVLGFKATSGRGESFKAGAKVVKNVTGFDLSKLITGSWGRLVAITELTLKVLPGPRSRKTIVLRGLKPDTAVQIMARALGSPAEVSAAAHLPNWQGAAATVFRLDGFPASVSARMDTLTALIGNHHECESLEDDASDALWNDLCSVTLLPKSKPLWRIVLAPSSAPAFVTTLPDDDWFMDWAGGLVWAATAEDPVVLRDSVAALGGHATLIRADAEMRSKVATFHPQPPGLAELESRVRRAFDPDGIFETGRF